MDAGTGPDPVLASTARFTADAPFQVLADGDAIYLFRQSLAGDHPDMISAEVAGHTGPLVDNMLLLDRYTVVGATLQLKRSATDNAPEPTSVLDFVRHLDEGRFAVMLLPTSEASTKRWQIFAYNPTQQIDAFNVKRSVDGRFDTTVPPGYGRPGDAAGAAATPPVSQTSLAAPSAPAGGQRIAGSTLQLDVSTTNYVDFGTLDFARTNYTVEMWLKATTQGQVRLLEGTVSNNMAQGMHIGLGADGRLRYVSNQGSSDASIASPASCNDGAPGTMSLPSRTARRQRCMLMGMLSAPQRLAAISAPGSTLSLEKNSGSRLMTPQTYRFFMWVTTVEP